MRKYILLFLIIFFCTPVYAQEFNMNSYTSATLNGTKNRYRATEIYNTGQSSTYTFGTRYNGRISDIETFFDYPFVENLTYRLTYNMATEDFRNNFGTAYYWDCDQTMTNNNAHVASVNYISYKKIQLSFKLDEATSCVRVWVRSTNLSSTAISGISNWQLNSITIYDPEWQSGSGSGQGSTTAPTPSPNNYQDIIDSQNNNTQDIINNQNSNTQDIIENNNQNTQEIVNSNKSCQFIDKNKVSTDGYLDSSGNLQDGGGQWGVTDFINIYNGTVKVTEPMVSGAYTCFYDSNKSITGCNSQANFVLDTYLNIPNNSSYARFSIYKTSNIPTFEVCINGNQAISDSITDSNVENGVGSDFFNNFSDQDFGLSSIITIPLTTIQSLTSKTCLALQVPIPFTNSNVSLPCMTEIYQNNVPTIYNLWKIVSFGLIAYFIAIDIFHMVKGFKDPESDKVEVLDL